MMPVFMDLAIGYLLMKEVAADRSFNTWLDRANERLTTFGTEVLYLVIDRAKALIKLAQKGFGCPSIPDLFHLGHDLWVMTWPRAIRWPSSLDCGKPNGSSNKPISTWRNGSRTSRQTLPTSPRAPGPGSGLRHLGPSLAGGGQYLAAAPGQFVAYPASLAAYRLDTPDIEGG